MTQPQEPHPVPEGMPGVEALLAQIAELQAQLARNEKIRKTLMERVERSIETAGSAYTLFERNILLEQSVSQSSLELKESETAYKALYDQSHLNEQRLETLYRLNQMADEPLNVLCQFTMEEAIRLTGSTIGYLAFVNEDETVLTMHAWSKSAMQECRIDDKPIVYPVEKTGLWGEAIRQRKPIITNDYSRPNPLKKGCPQGHVAIQRHMNAPIFDGDRIVIVAGVGNKASDYDEMDVRQMTLLMQGTWGIIRRKKAEETLLQNLKRSQDQQEVISRIAICSDVADGNVEAAAQRMTQQICTTVNVQRAGVWLFNEDGSELRCEDLFEGASGNHSRGEVLHRQQFCNEFEALETAQYVDAHDALTDPRTAGYVECYLKPLGITSMLDAAIRAGGKNLGFLCIEHVGPARRWQQDEIVFACQLADQIAVTLLNRRRRQDQQALRDSTDYFNAIFQNVSAGILLIDPATHSIVDANPLAAEMCGASVRDMRGKICQNYVCPADINKCPITDLGQKVDRSDRILVHSSRRRIPIQKSIQPVHIGGRDLLLESFVDISARKQAEETVRIERQRLASIIEGTHVGTWEWNVQKGEVVFNERWAQIVGCTLAELEPISIQTWFQMVHPDDLKESESKLHRHFAGELDYFDHECRMKHKNGSWIWVHDRGKVVTRTSDGKPLQMSGTRGDITDRKRAEEALRESEQKARAFFDSSFGFVGLLSPEGILLEINKTALDFAGIGASDVRGKPFWDTIWWSHNPEIQELIRSDIKSAATGKLVRGEAIHLAPDGTPHAIDYTVKPVPDDAGRVVRLIAEGRDITDHKQSEDKLRKAMEAANAANVAKSQFLANMSHEIRTPMNAILGFAELLAQDKLTPQQSDFVQTIRNSGSHLLNLINDILDFSKIEAGKMTLEFTDCSLEALLNELESLMAPFAQTKGLRFEMIMPKALPQTIRTDPVRLRQCLTNLVNNAIKFTDAGHVIVRTTLTESGDKSFFRFEVEDTGPGIDPQVQNKIFEAFEQADGSMTRKFGGTGLGLTITRHLAELFGGSLSLTSELGKGSTFIIEIPADTNIQDRPVQNGYPIPIPQESSKPLPQQFQGRVLVAEDVKTNQMLVRILLNQVGLQPVIVDDGQAAVEQVLRHEFDLILMDMQMPRLNGFEAARKLRKQGIRTPIVALTAGAIKGDEQKCLEAGCDEYLTKPIDRKKLHQILARFLPAAAGLQSPA